MGLSNRASQYGETISSEAITPNSASAFTVPAGTISALLTAGGEAIRWRTDGTPPTTSVGHYLAANANLEIFGQDITDIRIINTVAGGNCFVTYYRD